MIRPTGSLPGFLNGTCARLKTHSGDPYSLERHAVSGRPPQAFASHRCGRIPQRLAMLEIGVGTGMIAIHVLEVAGAIPPVNRRQLAEPV